jgi:glycosyltransferase involved in cell wall biosynthesis
MGYKVYIIGYSQKDEILDLEFAKLVHIKTPFNNIVAFGFVLISKYFVDKVNEIISAEKSEEVIIYGAGLWGIVGPKIQNSYPNINIKTLVGYFSTFKHDCYGQVIGSPIKDYGIVPYLYVYSIYLFAKWFYTPIEHKMLLDNNIIVVHYESTKNILLDEIGNSIEDKIKKIPYFVELYSRDSSININSEFVENKDLPTVSVLCRHDARKGINTFLKAIKILKNKNYKFNCIVAGTGFFRKYNILFAKKLGLADFIKFPGFVKSVESIYEITDIYVLPSVEEGSGAISLLEAMKFGLAIVTTKCDGIPEDFIDNETGMLVEMNNEEEMAKGIEKLLLSKQERERIASNVKNDYKKKFQFIKMQEKLTELIEGLN